MKAKSLRTTMYNHNLLTICYLFFSVPRSADSTTLRQAISLAFYIYRKFNHIEFLKNQKEKVNYFDY